MRPLLLALSATFALLVSMPVAAPVANAQGCTGPNCAQQSQGQGQGHQCEREKKEEVTS